MIEALDVLASFRPGGGDSYSGGGGFGGGGGGGGGGGDGGDAESIAALLELLFHLIRLCVYYPKIGLPIVGLIIGFFVYSYIKKQKNKDWDSGPPIELKKAVSLDRIREVDPDFSPILFEDFVFRLYASALEAKHSDRMLEALSPYLQPSARSSLAAREPRVPVTGVIVGAIRPFRVWNSDPSGKDPCSQITVEVETNYTTGGDASRTFYAVEHWWFTRAQGARTRRRDLRQGFPCPNCGAPWQAKESQEGQRCAFCDQVVDNGRFDWQVFSIDLPHIVDKPPTLTTEVPERGTDLPTFRHDAVDHRWGTLLADDPQLTEQAFQARVHLIFTELYAAWDALDLDRARVFLSDGLHDYLRYWIDAYKRGGLRNRLEGMRMTHAVFAKVTRDRWYDAVTIRIWGTGRDYVVRERTGEHVKGSKSKDRKFSEYWTLIRSAQRRGPARTEPVCSNCGAPARIAMTGACEYCGAMVTSGDFDWVLSKIEQDDSYRG